MKNYEEIAYLRTESTFHIEKAYDKGYDRGYNDCKVELTDDEAKCHYQEGYNDGYRKGVERGRESRVAEADCAYQCGLRKAWDAAKKIVLSAGNGGYSADIVRKLFGMTYHDVLVSASPLRVIEKIEEWEKKQKENEKVDCNNTDCKNCINHNDCDYEDELELRRRGIVPAPPKEKQTEKNCENCGHHRSGDVGCEAGGCSLIRENWIPQEKQDVTEMNVGNIEVGDEVTYNLNNVMVVTRIYSESRSADLLRYDGTVEQQPLEILAPTGKHYDIQALLDAMKSEKTEEGGE